MIKKIAPETDSAAAKRLTTTVASVGVKRPKLMKMILSHRTRMISIGKETELTLCSYINQRVCTKPNGKTQRLGVVSGLLIVLRRKSLDFVVQNFGDGSNREPRCGPSTTFHRERGQQ